MAIITISRGTFTGGKALAERLAERLDYQCISREVLWDAEHEYGVSSEQLVAALERPPSFWQHLTGERTRYLSYVRATLCEHAVQGNLIYHGHAGHLLLTGVSHVIRVRVITDLESRINEAMQRLSMERKEALAHIRKLDQERMKWTKFLYGVDWYDASLFDIVINLERIGLDGASEVVARMTEVERFQETPESRKAMADLALGSRVWAALARDPRTTVAEVKVAADDGAVVIAGSTTSEEVLEAIPVVAGQVEGVREIRCLVGMGTAFTR